MCVLRNVCIKVKHACCRKDNQQSGLPRTEGALRPQGFHFKAGRIAGELEQVGQPSCLTEAFYPSLQMLSFYFVDLGVLGTAFDSQDLPKKENPIRGPRTFLNYLHSVFNCIC